MEKYDVLPNDENVVESFSQDATGRNDDVYQLARLIASQKESWSIAVNSPWGTGKTFFVKQVKWLLDAENGKGLNDAEQKALNVVFGSPDDENRCLLEKGLKKAQVKTVYYDAWAADGDDDPLKSLLAALVMEGSWSPEARENIKKVVDVGLDLIQMYTKIDLSTLVDGITSKRTKREQLQYDFRKGLRSLTKNDERLVIFVDELDRCKPTYAVKLLERIKHYFNVPNITFIFSVDLSALQHTVKGFYGSQFDGLGYLDRFFDLVVPLQPANVEKYLQNTNNILSIDELIGGPIDKADNYYHRFCSEIIKHFSLSLRQINHFYLRMNSALFNVIKRNGIRRENLYPQDYGRVLVYIYILTFMVSLSIKDIEEYNQFIAGKSDKAMLEVFSKSYEFGYFINSIESAQPDYEVDTMALSNTSQQIYDAIFKDNNVEQLEVSEGCSIYRPSAYKQPLIKVCSLLMANSR